VSSRWFSAFFDVQAADCESDTGVRVGGGWRTESTKTSDSADSA